MRISSNKIKSFEPATSGDWTCSISGGSIDTSKFNIAGGILPATNIRYDRYKVGISSITVGPDIPIDIPNTVLLDPKTITMTVHDDDKLTISNGLYTWCSKGLDKNRSPSKSDYAVLTIYKYNKSGKSIATESFYVFPTGELPWAGDQQFQAVTYSLTFTVYGRQSKR